MSDRAYAKILAQQKTLIGSSPKSSLLQRTCACGQHTIAGGECSECRNQRSTLLRSQRAFGSSTALVTAQNNSSVHGNVSSLNSVVDSASPFGHDFSQIPVYSSQRPMLQTKLTVNQPEDPYEQEADQIAGQVMRMANLKSSLSDGEDEAKNSLIRKQGGESGTDRATGTSSVPPIVQEVLNSSGGQPLDPAARAFMEPRFGHDFSRVRIHSDAKAAESAREINALAYTVGRDIVFGVGQYTPQTVSGQRLLAHELTHVVQQQSYTDQPHAVQREAFSGGPGKMAPDKDRPLTGYAGPLPYTPNPGGTVVSGTASTAQNCAGDSCSVKKWINWPFLGYEVPGVRLPADWDQATKFVPTGCTRVNCSGIDVNNTRCKASELELIAFLYRWPVMLNVGGKPMAGTQSDFHMIGRDAHSLPGGWHSKMDRREKVADIRDPLQSLYDSYPHTKLKDRTIQQLCFCCNQSEIKTI